MTLSLGNMPLRMIVERGSAGRDWSAWLESEPHQACGGTTITSAVRRWLSLNSDRFPGPYALLLDEQESTLDRRLMLLTAVTKCSECGGSGKYVGLVLVEECSTCQGTGLVSEELPVV
ncbi:MAG: hypothetical protein IH899_16430 [Planctomycetes bacterium]|nr:hypothetical protein [Planctomycetota bacterium]